MVRRLIDRASLAWILALLITIGFAVWAMLNRGSDVDEGEVDNCAPMVETSESRDSLDAPTLKGAGAAKSEPKVTEARDVTDLSGGVTVRWPLENKGIGIPADGSTVDIKPWTNTGRLTVPPKGVIEGHELVVPGWRTDGASGYAVIPGKGIARITARPGQETGRPTAFYPLRRIELIARLPDGSAATGWYLVVRSSGNNFAQPPVKTNAEGKAVMTQLYGGPRSLVEVSVADSPRQWGGFSKGLGSVDLAKHDGHFEVVLPAERTMHIRLEVPGGEAAGHLTAFTRIGARSLKAAKSDESGLLIVRWRPVVPDATVRVSVNVRGFTSEHEEVSLAAAEDPIEVTIELHLAGSVRVAVTEPEDKRYGIDLERWNEDRQSWGSASKFGNRHGSRADANGLVLFLPLTPGRYRVIETRSKLVSEPFDVPADGEPVRISFDASATGWVKGKVEVPEGVPFGGIRVGEVGAEPEMGLLQTSIFDAVPLPGRRVSSKDGTFAYRVSSTEPVTLRIYHALLKPHPTKGYVTVRGPQEGVILTAVRGPVATVRFDTPARVRANPGQLRTIAVHLYPGAVEGKGIRLPGLLDGTHMKVEFGGFERGTYTVWIDAPGYAPVVMKDVKLTESDVDLGEVTLKKGSVFRVNVRVKEGQSPPRLFVAVRKLDDPTYIRSMHRSAETITVQGIGAGRFKVSAHAFGGGLPPLDEEMEFDGTTEVVRTIDAR